MHTVHNARITLLATALNNLALAVIVAGCIAPVVSGQLAGSGQVVATLAWIAAVTILHFFAQGVLGGLRQ